MEIQETIGELKRSLEHSIDEEVLLRTITDDLTAMRAAFAGNRGRFIPDHIEFLRSLTPISHRLHWFIRVPTERGVPYHGQDVPYHTDLPVTHSRCLFRRTAAVRGGSRSARMAGLRGWAGKHPAFDPQADQSRQCEPTGGGLVLRCAGRPGRIADQPHHRRRGALC